MQLTKLGKLMYKNTPWFFKSLEHNCQINQNMCDISISQKEASEKPNHNHKVNLLTFNKK